MNYIQYKQWADHCESLQHQAIDLSLSDEDDDEFDDTEDVDNEFAIPCLAVTICVFSFIIAMFIV
jgi:hypothetical protein